MFCALFLSNELFYKNNFTVGSTMGKISYEDEMRIHMLREMVKPFLRNGLLFQYEVFRFRRGTFFSLVLYSVATHRHVTSSRQ